MQELINAERSRSAIELFGSHECLCFISVCVLVNNNNVTRLTDHWSVYSRVVSVHLDGIVFAFCSTNAITNVNWFKTITQLIYVSCFNVASQRKSPMFPLVRKTIIHLKIIIARNVVAPECRSIVFLFFFY